MAGPTRTASLVTVLFVLVIVVSVNLLGSRFFTRLDLTERKEFTISSSTRTVLDKLDDVVNVKVYFSRNLPPYLATLDRQVKDLLDEYRARAGGNLIVEFLDPAADPATERAVQAMGIPKLQLNIIQKDKAEVTGAFLGIAVEYADKSEVLPVVQDVTALEYDLTAAIVKATTEPRTIGFSGSAEATLTQGLQGLQQLLARQYVLQPVSLDSGPVPEGVATLIVVDHDDLTETALYNLDQFLMRGGRVLALVPSVAIPQTSLAARDRQVRMAGLLRDWGIEVRNGLVADGESAMASFSQGYVSFTVPYPWWPQATGEGLSGENPITHGLDSIVLPWTSPLATAAVDSASGAAVSTEVLVTSSSRSFAATAPYNLDPQSRLSLPPTGAAPQALAVAARGRFPSHWTGRPAPGDSLGTGPAPAVLSPETQLVVVGSWQFLGDQFLSQFPSNATFVANAVDWMTLGNDLIAIRSRGGASRPLKQVADGTRSWIKILAVLGMPVLVVIGGLVRMRVRKLTRLRFAREYGGAA